jgi:hypothetical protein
MKACLDILQAGHPVEDPGALKRSADTQLGDHVGRQTSDVNGIEGYLTPGRRYQPRNQIEESSFAGAVRPNEAMDLSFPDLNVQSIDGP